MLNQNTNTKDSFIASFLESYAKQDASSLQGSMAFEEKLGFPTYSQRQTPSYPIVIDACVMRNEIRRFLSMSNEPTFIQEAHQSGVGVIHAPKWLETELENSTLPSLYKTERISPRILNRAAEQLLGEIKLHSAYDKPVANYLPDGADLKDEPYVRLARDINALGVLSWDKGFAKYEIRSFKEDVIKDIRQIARLLNAEIHLKIAGKFSTVITVNLTEELVKAAPALLKKIPPPMLVAALGAATFYLTGTKSGRQHAKQLGTLALSGATKLGGILLESQRQIIRNQQEVNLIKDRIETTANMS